ncbi:MAG: Lrp/AsnC ligand binding domain-containing protein [Candidatus Nezhaarchaeota archaeon]|nr:Lrp/AsnC ligand binding domain-containing protein [Candidatus Nezhaarchaeota archaeon]
MTLAFVLINSEAGAEEEILEKLTKIDGVKEAYSVYGVYDIVVKIEAPDMEKLKEIVHTKIRRIEKIRSTLTMIAFEERRKQ